MRLALCDSYKNLSESLQAEMALTGLTATSFAFVLLEEQLCSCTEETRAWFIHSVFSALYKDVQRELYLLTWGVKLKPLRG